MNPFLKIRPLQRQMWWRQWPWWWRWQWCFSFPLTMGLLLLLNTIVFNYFDNPMRIFQDEETEAYLGVIAQDLGWPRGRARVWTLMELPVSLLCSLVRCFKSLARQNSHLCCLWLEWGVLLGVQAADLLFFTSSHVAGLCAWSMSDWLGGQFWLRWIQIWLILENVSLFNFSPFKNFIIRIRGGRRWKTTCRSSSYGMANKWHTCCIFSLPLPW